MTTSIVAEFAGTKDEARAFAKENGLNFAQVKGTKPNGLPYVSLTIQRVEDVPAAIEKFNALGWDRHSISVKRASRATQ